jgi:hypothetical protein
MDIWLAWFDSYDEKARTADSSGPGFNPDFNFDFPYEIELEFEFETINVLEENRKDLAI